MDEEAGELSEVRVRSSVLADTPGVRGPGGGAGGARWCWAPSPSITAGRRRCSLWVRSAEGVVSGGGGNKPE